MLNILAIAVIAILTLTYGILLLMYPPLVVIGGRIVYLSIPNFATAKLSDLSQINFHYDALGPIGFEFVKINGIPFLARAQRVDDGLLKTLQRVLPNFSSDLFYEEWLCHPDQ
jgi:hypothetical protein